MMASLQRLFSVLLLIGLVTSVLLIYRLIGKTAHRPITSLPSQHKIAAVEASADLAHPQSGVVQGYCNFPENISLGLEGLSPKGYTLVSVLTLVRHGNRLPMDTTPPLGPLNIPKVSCIMSTAASSMPEMLSKFIEKTNVDSPWPRQTLRPTTELCGVTALTQIGVEQHIRTGQVLNKVYNVQLGLSQEHIKVVSTTRSRTYHSVVAFVFGLLGGQVDYTTLPIEARASVSLCNAVQPTDCRCPQANAHLAQGEKVLHRLRRSDPYFAQFSSSLKQSLGDSYDLHPPYPWKTAHDMMISRLCRKEPLPCNSRYCIRESQADMSWQSLNFYHQRMSGNEDLVKAAKLEIYQFLSEIVSRLSNHSTQASAPIKDRFTVYSGHDNTLIPLLLALELQVKQWPPFASRLIFELYKPIRTSESKDFLFKLIYNGEDITRELKFCVSKTGWSQTSCALKDLINYVHNLLSSLGATSYRQACRATHGP